ncbi:PDR/VanB family oxidoreductase [Variovorax sp. VNK109]|uniref:PDR/VanB family oxidoreductase n=1 Tax=Variovorax sp. VNK109 TaxID=3400919 RepID=UPI003C0E41AB
MLQTIVVQVQRARKLNSQVIEYELGSSEADLPEYTPGAHIEVRVPGVGPRHYSLVRTWEATNPYVIAVQREAAGRGGSRWMHDSLEVGATLEIGPPKNNFPLHDDDARIILIAGGIGITPVLCMAEALDRAGRAYELVVCVRDLERLPYADDVSALVARGKAVIVVSDGSDGNQFVLSERFPDLAGPVRIYTCGPASLMQHVREATAGMPGVSIHEERFGAAPVPAVPVGPLPFRVRCARSGLVVPVDAGQSMLDALLDAGLDIDHSCREGYCGTCLTKHIDGSPIHLDSCLGQEERSRYVAVCVSRALNDSEIVLDI